MKNAEKSKRPQLRMAPPAEVLAGQQEVLERLLKADEWTQEPANPPAELAKAAQKAIEERERAAARKPWEEVSQEVTHAYHVVLPKRLFLKLDYVWKRGGYRSAREFVIRSLENAANEGLEKLGEKP